MKRIFNFRLGNSDWSLSLGEYVILLVAVLVGWLAGHALSREPVLADYAATHHVRNGTNATGISPGAGRDLASK